MQLRHARAMLCNGSSGETAMVVVLLLTLGFVLSSCGQAPTPKPTEDEKQAALRTVTTCLEQNVDGLDDGKSDARTIAEALVSVCAKEYRTAAALSASEVPLRLQPAYFEQVRARWFEPALRTVLYYRRLQRGP
jgi:hypothetical protein